MIGTNTIDQGFAFNDTVPVHIDIGIQATLDQAYCLEIESGLHRLLRDLADDLGLRLAFDLQVGTAGADDEQKGELHSVEINGVPCRLDRTLGISADLPQDAMASAIFAVLFQNRALLIDERFLEIVCRSLADDRGTDPPVDIVKQGLTDALERCFDLEVGLELCRVRLDGGEDPEYESELLIATRFAKTIQVEVGRTQYDAVMMATKDSESGEKSPIDEMAQMMRDGLFYELGIRLQPLEFVFGEKLKDQEFRIMINCLRGPLHRGIVPGEVLVNDTVDRLTLLNIKGREAVNPANGTEAAIIPAEYAEICEQAGLTTWDSAGYMILTISATLRRHAPNYFTIAQAEYNLGLLDQAFPMLVFNVLERYPMVTVTRVLRSLLSEQVSIRDLRSVLEAMLSLNGVTDVDHNRYIVFTSREVHLAESRRNNFNPSEAEIVEFVRGAMSRYLSHKYTRGGNTLVTYLMDAEIEEGFKNTNPLDAAEKSRLIRAVDIELQNSSPSLQTPLILTATGVRARLRREIEMEYPHLAVLSYQELSPDLSIQPIARISWSEQNLENKSASSAATKELKPEPKPVK